jgi:hypothetical protein
MKVLLVGMLLLLKLQLLLLQSNQLKLLLLQNQFQQNQFQQSLLLLKLQRQLHQLLNSKNIISYWKKPSMMLGFFINYAK